MYKIYMVLENPRRDLFVDKVDNWFEAAHRLELYFNKNPHEYYIVDGEGQKVNMFDIIG